MTPDTDPSFDPRHGDIEDDASSTKSRSMLSLAGSLLAEISIPKLLTAWITLIAVPSLMLGVAPIVAAIWFHKLSDKFTTSLLGVWSATLLIGLAVLGWYGGRRVLRLAEKSFWSLNSLAVQPCYAACREALRHLIGRRGAGGSSSAMLHAVAAIVSGLLICGVSLLILWLAWPFTYLSGNLAILSEPKHLALAAIANSAVLVSGYVAVAALIWAIADATMAPPQDLASFPAPPANARTWRIVHLSDIHVVGERYGFRIECGRSGPRGNMRLHAVLARLAALHGADPLDAVLISGDITDAGSSAEWAEFLDAIAPYPELTKLMLILPGNHDLNIVDRANPARLDLPGSLNKRLRKLRMLGGILAVQGDRARVVDRQSARLGDTVAAVIKPKHAALHRFADAGQPRLTSAVTDLWNNIFPMVLPPDHDDGLGIVLFDSNADAHFSFTNALGLMPAEQARAFDIARRQYPNAVWLLALHHHLVEYPTPAKALSERIGTALVNGNWFVRWLRPLADRVVLMHGHRHVDWIGTYAGLQIVSAPSPVMEATDDMATCFYIHTLAAGPDGRLMLLKPERIAVAGTAQR
jgi:hypothetical protein